MNERSDMHARSRAKLLDSIRERLAQLALRFSGRDGYRLSREELASFDARLSELE